MSERKIAFVLRDLSGGGTEKVTINLISELASRGVNVELVIGRAAGEFLDSIPPNVKVVNLNIVEKHWLLLAIRMTYALAKYLRQSRPNIVHGNLIFINWCIGLAKKMSRSPAFILLFEHNQFNARSRRIFKALGLTQVQFRAAFMRIADAIVAPSRGMAESLRTELRLRDKNVDILPNCVVSETIERDQLLPVDNPWFAPGSIPVIVAIGRLCEQKDFRTLIAAFALVLREQEVRLVILGEGELRGELERFVRESGVSENVLFLGFQKNPYRFLSRASAFVLSSAWETLPTVLIEAMACGCPVVSTQCNFGPDEILENGRFGPLVPVGDALKMAKAIQSVLAKPISPETLKMRASSYSGKSGADALLRYLGANGQN